MTGRLKSYSPLHGYGFIVSGEKDYMFSSRDWKAVDEEIGTIVEFTPVKTIKGLRARNIRKE